MDKQEIEKLKKLLSSKKLDAWKIEIESATRTNLYFIKHLAKEATLNADRTNVTITAYKMFGDKIGDSSFSIIGFDEHELAGKIDLALAICEYSKKPRFSLPSKSQITKRVKLKDDLLVNAMPSLAKIHGRIKNELSSHANIKCNNLEMHATYAKVRVINSLGIDVEDERTGLYIELTITASKNEKGMVNEQEYVCAKGYASIARFDIKAFVDECVRLVNDVLNSNPIDTFEGRVALSRSAIHDFFSPLLALNPLVMHASARMKYLGMSRYVQGAEIASAKADKISIALNPWLELNPGSSHFDGDGVPSIRVELVKDGKFGNYFASKQYADYLKIKPTGALGCVEIDKGSLSENLLLRMMPYIEIVSFSSFSPNSISGDFSAEIRLGYLVDKDKEGMISKKPFKGGLFVGNVFNLIEETYLSDKIIEEAGYRGPSMILFTNSTVSGLR